MKKTEKSNTNEIIEIPAEEAPYALPDGWKWVRGLDIFEPMKSKKPSGEYFYYIDIDSIDNKRQMVSSPKKLRVSEAPSRANRELHCGDTVFSLVRPYLKNIAYIDESLASAIASTGFFVCTPNKNLLNPKYNYYLMISNYVVDGLNSFMKGDNSPSIRNNDIEKFCFPLPPLETQKRIVDRIESLFAKLDEAKEKAQTALDTFELRKSAILHKAFTGELTAKWRKENANQNGNMNSIGWDYKKISDFATVKGGKRLPKGKILITEKTSHPYLRIADFGDETVLLDDIHYISEDVYMSINRYIIRKEDVYISIVGTIGKCGIIPKELDGANLTENAARIITDKTLPLFLVRYLNSPIAQKDIKARIRSATLGKLSITNINLIVVPIPPLPEQQEIVRILDDLLAKENAAKEAAEAVIEKIDLMKKSILARAFRGELL